MPTRFAKIFASACTAAALPILTFAQAPASADELVRAERLRAQVEAVYADLANPPERDEHAAPLFDSITERLVAIGPDIGPAMISEIEGRSRVSFNVTAYMLGLLRTPGGREALLRAAEAANHDGGEFGKDRLAWISYALGVMGDAAAVDVLDSGRLNVVRKPFVEGMTILEISSILTAAEARPRLLAKLARYTKDEELTDRLPTVLTALRRVADPSIVEAVTPFLAHPEPYVREAAARALAASGDPKVADRLFAALDDPVPYSKFGVAASIETLKPAGKTKTLLAKLENEENTAARGALYRTLAATAPESQVVQTFAASFGRPDPLDRVAIVDALGAMKSRKGINLLRTAVQDSDQRVTLHAMDALASIGGTGVTETLLALLRDPRWSIEGSAIRELAARREKRAIPRIADRLREEIATPLPDPSDRDALNGRGAGLIELRDASVLPALEAALDVQTDPAVQSILSSLAKRMRALRDFGDDRAKWAAATTSEDADIRELAYPRLVELPGEESLRALTDAFGRVDVPEGFEILRAVGRIGSPEAAPLVERVLLEPAFDSYERLPLRRMAAWAAMRIGGERMTTALKKSVERRSGRDADVLVYLGVLAGRDALPELDRYRFERFRYFNWYLGPEWDRLDWLAREIRAGRPVQALNRPPDEIALYPILP